MDVIRVSCGAARCALPIAWGALLACTGEAPDTEPATSALTASEGALTAGSDEGDDAASAALVDDTTPAGTWYLMRTNFDPNPVPYELTLAATGDGGFAGTIDGPGYAPATPLTAVVWDPVSRWLEFRAAQPFEWYRLSLVQGTLSGRVSRWSALKPPLTDYEQHVTGWSPGYVDAGIVPRVWRITLDGHFEAVLRVDRDAAGILRGRLKVYDDSLVNAAQEELEYDLGDVDWDGADLSFTRVVSGVAEHFSGAASGRTISGTFTRAGDDALHEWHGARAQVLGFGLGSRLPERAAWQALTRVRLQHLTQGMRLATTPMPPVSVSEEPCDGCPFDDGYFDWSRDDDPSAYPLSYTLRRLRFEVQPWDRFDPDNPPDVRVFRGYLALPPGPPPPGGWRGVVAINGHGGSASKVMSTGDWLYWYGESFARRGFVVLAIDIGHSNPFVEGVYHPSIIARGYTTSDWEQVGERAFDISRALDYLRSLKHVRKREIFLVGHSMGGETTAIAAGLDPRFRMAVVSGYYSDWFVLDQIFFHYCYHFFRGSVHEYVDGSDYLALLAPRPLVFETGRTDDMASRFDPPFANAKQAMRRAWAAYGRDGDDAVHYLFNGFHYFHVGGPNWNYDPAIERGVRATLVNDATAPDDPSWQVDASTYERSPTLYDLIDEFIH